MIDWPTPVMRRRGNAKRWRFAFQPIGDQKVGDLIVLSSTNPMHKKIKNDRSQVKSGHQRLGTDANLPAAP